MTHTAGRAGRADRPTLVGRARELATLGERLAAALAGRGSLVLLGGEAGIGKTTLAEALAAEAAARGALALAGHCYDLTETPPYGPWLDLFRRYPLDAGPAPPDILAQPGVGGNPTSQYALFRQVADSLAAAAARRPLLLVLDDLHWADQASLDLLRFVARELGALPLLLVATYRSDELTRRHPLYALLPLLVREAGAARLDLRPLGEEDLLALVRARYGLPAADEARLVTYLRGHAEGNPFYAGELLRTLEEEQLLQQRENDWWLGDPAAAHVPPLLRQVIDGRVDRLGEAARDLLAVAAVLGQDVPLALWAAVAETAEGALYPTVERAVEARLLAETPDGAGVRYAHALVREALYEGVLGVRRRALHRRAGEVLAARPAPDPDAVAHHLQQAGDLRAAEWLVRAGERAQRAYAWLTAAERFEAALPLLECQGAAAGERGWLHLRLGLLRRYADSRRALIHLERAERLAAAAGDAALVAHATFNRGLVLCYTWDMGRGLSAMEAGTAALAALAALDEAQARQLRAQGFTRDADHHRATLALYLAIAGHLARALSLGEQVVSRLSVTATDGELAGAYACDAAFGLGWAYTTLGRPAEARDAFARARAAYGALGNDVNVAMTACHELRAVLAYQTERLAERHALVNEAEHALARAGEARYTTDADLARLVRFRLLLLEGRGSEAREVARFARRLRPWGLMVVETGDLAALARREGDRDLAWRLVGEDLPAGASTSPGATHFASALALLGTAAGLALDLGDLAAARAWLEAHDRWLEWSGAVLGRAEGQLGWAAYHRAAGDPAAARRHAEAALAHAADPRQPLALLAAHRLLGELDTAAGRHAEAGAHLDAALALADACAAPYERALTLLALADLRAAAGRRDAAAEHLDEARAILTPLGAAPALARAEAIAAALATAAPPAARYPAGLTAREVEVLRLVAQGLTDAQAAERLYLSTRTVSQHLRSVYNKLGVSSRAAAARFAAEHGLT